MFAHIWMDGNLIREEDAVIPVTTHGLHYGTAVFDGGRFYHQPDGEFGIFRARDHLERFMSGCRSAFLTLPFTFDDLWQATIDVVSTASRAGYVRQLAFPGHGTMGVGAQNRVRTVIMAWEPEAKASKNIRVRLSALRGTILPGTKLAGQYAQVFLTQREAATWGADDTLFVDSRGCVSEASAAAVFLVTRNQLRTPPLYEPMLPSITRDSVIKIARALSLEVVEVPIRADELFSADEVFLASSASALRPVGQIEGRHLPTENPVTLALMRAYSDVVEGREPAFSHWVTKVSRKAVSK